MWQTVEIPFTVKKSLLFCVQQRDDEHVETRSIGVTTKGQQVCFCRDIVVGHVSEITWDQHGTPVPWVEADALPEVEATWYDAIESEKSAREVGNVWFWRGLDHFKYGIGNAIAGSASYRGYSRQVRTLLPGDWSDGEMTISFDSDGTYRRDGSSKRQLLVSMCSPNGKWEIVSDVLWLLDPRGMRGVKQALINMNQDAFWIAGEISGDHDHHGNIHHRFDRVQP
ncbi:MAG: hypothetical protein AAGK09_13015 [Planctomycetota bacterium]